MCGDINEVMNLHSHTSHRPVNLTSCADRISKHYSNMGYELGQINDVWLANKVQVRNTPVQNQID